MASSVANLQFGCRVGGADLCANGGLCVTVNETAGSVVFQQEEQEQERDPFCYERCTCPSGFTHDNDFFHFPNCTRLPQSSLWFFVEFGAVSLAVLALLVRFLRRRDPGAGSNRRAAVLVRCMCASMVTGTAAAASILAQDGCFEACAVLANTSFAINALCLSLLVLTLTRPLFGAQLGAFKRFARFVWVLFGVLCGLFLAAMGAMLAHTRDRNPARYNGAALFSVMAVFWGAGIQAVLTFVWSRRLQAEMSRSIATVQGSPQRSSTTLNKLRGLQMRTRVLQMLTLALVLLILPSAVAIMAIIFSLRSIPFFYLVTYGYINTSPVFALTVLFFLGDNGSDQSSPSSLDRRALRLARRCLCCRGSCERLKQTRLSVPRSGPVGGHNNNNHDQGSLNVVISFPSTIP